MFVIMNFIVILFESTIIYGCACILDIMLSEHYDEPLAKWNFLKNILD